jgi:hypothetical protein
MGCGEGRWRWELDVVEPPRRTRAHAQGSCTAGRRVHRVVWGDLDDYGTAHGTKGRWMRKRVNVLGESVLRAGASEGAERDDATGGQRRNQLGLRWWEAAVR